MCKFLQHIYSFSVPLALCYGLNLLVNMLVIFSGPSPMRNVRTLIAGDSHLQVSLDPSRFGAARNICQWGEPYIVTYWKLQSIFSGTRLDTVILGFSHHNISGFNDMKFTDTKWSHEMFRRTYAIQHFTTLKGLDVDHVEFLRTCFRHLCLYPSLNHWHFIGSYAPVDRNDISDFEATIEAHYSYRGHDAGISNVSIAYLDSIVQLCQHHRATLLLLGTPVHTEYHRRIPRHVRKRYSEEKRRLMKQRIFVLDLADRIYDDSCYLNADHLNRKGAERFTSEVVEMLNHAIHPAQLGGMAQRTTAESQR